MRVGIITFSASHNCGSMLQAFALQEVLKRRYSADVEIIDFINAGSRKIYNVITWELSRYAIEHNWNSIIHLPTMLKVKKDYTEFSNIYLKKTSKSYYNENQLTGFENRYDLLIAGGDQVWNVRVSDGSDAFFLNFVKNVRKVSYSPSLGGTNIMKFGRDPDRYRQYLSEFEAISVREPNGQKWLEELTGRKVKIIADPTLILTPEEWQEYLPVPDIKEKYIFNYAFYHNRKKTNIALQKISDKVGLPIYVMDIKSWAIYRLDKYNIKKYPKTGPLAFLGLMKNAQLVLTQSFHGTLFSALFNRCFWSYNWEEMTHGEDDRATAILEQLGLNERYQMIDDLVNMSVMEPIDYEECNKNIGQLRQEAYDYIDSFMKR